MANDKSAAVWSERLTNWAQNYWWMLVLSSALLFFSLFWINNEKINLWASQINTQTLEFYKAVGTVLVALIAAGIASVIQWRQMKIADAQALTARQKLNFDLFDRRFAVYQAAKSIIDRIRFEDDITKTKVEFRAEVAEAEWLFDIKIHHYLMIDLLEEAGNRVHELRKLASNGRISDEYKEKLRSYGQWGDWQYVKIREMFRPYVMLNQS